MVDTLGLISIFVLAGIYFVIFHQLFDVFYFGIKGIGTTIIGCVFAAILTIGLVVEYWIWVVGIGGVVIFLVLMGKKTE